MKHHAVPLPHPEHTNPPPGHLVYYTRLFKPPYTYTLRCECELLLLPWLPWLLLRRRCPRRE